MKNNRAPIGIFDSGYGGLTIFEQIQKKLPQFDYLYLGDNARTPYGMRSFEVVYQFTKQAVCYLFESGCPLVILACNTASAKALRTIQQNDLPEMDPDFRVLGVIRPTVETLYEITQTKHIGVLATPGTIASESYQLEIAKLFPDLTVVGEACPMWVPLVENKEFDLPGADYFVQKHIEQLLKKDSQIDTIILGCTHYPMLAEKIKQYLPQGITLLSQGLQVADSLKDYLYRHPGMENRISKGSTTQFLTTESVSKFSEFASIFFNHSIHIEQIKLD